MNPEAAWPNSALRTATERHVTEPERQTVRALHADDADDASLVAGLARGDGNAAAAVWDRHSPRVRRFLRRTLAVESDVEDLLQDTFVRVFRDIERLREPDKLASFALGIAANLLRMELRRRRRWRWIQTRDVVPELPVQAHQAAHDAVRRLGLILADLSPDLRVSFVLRHVEGLQLAAIGDAMGWSLATTKRRLGKARRLVLARAANDPVLIDYLDPDGGSP